MIKIGLAFGGGGARGGAHIGVIYEMEKIGLKANLITGTSVGGLVAALYAVGLPAEKIHRFFSKFSFSNLYALPGSSPAISSVSKFEPMLEDLIGRPSFADLETPLALVATNLVSKKEVVLDEGDVVSAVLASMAFPILLPPVEREGLVLVDGGLVNNVPFDVARARGAHFVIAVDLGNASPYGVLPDGSSQKTGLIERALNATKRRPMYQVMTAVTDIITHRVVTSRLAISPPDLMLRPDIGSIGLLDFQDLERAIQAGRRSLLEVVPEIQERIDQITAGGSDA